MLGIFCLLKICSLFLEAGSMIKDIIYNKFDFIIENNYFSQKIQNIKIGIELGQLCQANKWKP